MKTVVKRMAAGLLAVIAFWLFVGFLVLAPKVFLIVLVSAFVALAVASGVD